MKYIYIILSLFISISLFSQTNYYVKNGGDDSANGLSDAAAWETLSKVNSSTFSAGDSILFNRGDVWRMQTLDPPSSGTSSDYITFSNYGSGQRPKFFGSRGVTEYTAHPTLSSVYVCNDAMTTNPNNYDATGYAGSIWYSIDDSITWGDGNLQYVDDLASLSSNYEWTWQNDSVYFYYDGSISDIDTIECTQSERGIDINEEYLVIDGFDVRYYGSRCVGTSIYPEGYARYGLKIRNNHLAYTGSKDGGVGYGIQIFYSDLIIERNVIHSQGRRMIGVHTFDQSGSITVRNVYIQDNECYDGWHASGCGIGVNGNNHEFRNIHVRRNYFWDYDIDKFAGSNAVSIINNSNDLQDLDSVYVYNNILSANGSGIFVGMSKYTWIVNNTFVATTVSSGYHITCALADSTGGYTIMNNIFFNPSTTHSYDGIKGMSDFQTRLDTCDYNLHYEYDVDAYMFDDILRGNFRYSEFDEVQDSLMELNSQEPPQEPHFIDSANNRDYHLKVGSPAINMGYPSWLTPTDKDGNVRSLATPTIGAYEYIAIDSTETDITSFSIPNQVSSTITAVDSSIAVVMPYGTNVTSLTATWTLADLATSSPLSSTSQNYTTPLTIDVTAYKGNSQEWEVTVTAQSAPPVDAKTYYEANGVKYQWLSGEFMAK